LATGAATAVKLPPPEIPVGYLLALPAEGGTPPLAAENAARAKEALKVAKRDKLARAQAYAEASRWFEAAADYEEAGKWASKAAAATTNATEAGGIYLGAGALYEKAGRYKKAAAVFEKVARLKSAAAQLYPWRGEMMAVGEVALVQAGLCRSAAGDWRRAAAAYGEYISRYNERPIMLIWVYYQLGRALGVQGKEKDARSAFQKALDVVRSNMGRAAVDLSPALDAAAGAEFYLAEYDYLEFTTYRLRLPQDKMEKDLKAMVSISQRLVGAYTDVATAGASAWQPAAYCRLGDTYAAFADALDAAEVPKELNPRKWRRMKPGDPTRAEAEAVYAAYRRALAEQTTPLREKAAENYRAALSAAGDAAATDARVTRARAALERLPAVEAP
jgi:tetratricopeptide (TPR) repeat protein